MVRLKRSTKTSANCKALCRCLANLIDAVSFFVFVILLSEIFLTQIKGSERRLVLHLKILNLNGKEGKMKKLLILLCVATLVLGTVKSSFALTIIQDTDSGSIQILYHSPVGQSFTATDTDIGYVGFMIEPYNQDINDLSLTMSLYEGAGDFSSPLLTESFLLSNHCCLTNSYRYRKK